jgi:type IV secretory pathway VirB2 component (pilin)
MKKPKKFIALFILSFILFALVGPLFASTAEAMPWETPLNKIMASLSGPVPKIIGTLMIVGAGIAIAFTEGQAVPKGLWILIGLGIALNAASFLTMLFGNANGFIF